MSYLYGITVSSGERRPIIDVLSVARDGFTPASQEWLANPARQTELDALSTDGFTTFVESKTGVAGLAKSVMAASLADSGIAAGDVDAVMFSTESFWDTENPEIAPTFDAHVRLRHGFLQAVAEVGLLRAFPYANWMSACANLGSSLALTRALLSAGQHRRVLVVCADKVPSSIPRLMGSGAAVFSDLAAGCMVGPEQRGFELKAVVSCAAPAVASFNYSPDSRKEMLKFMHEMILALTQLKRDFEKASGRPLGSFETIIGGHFHPNTLRVICDVLHVRHESLSRSGRSNYAHAFAADNLVTLAQMDAEGLIAPGQDVLLLNTGVWSWNVVWLVKVADDPDFRRSRDEAAALPTSERH